MFLHLHFKRAQPGGIGGLVACEQTGARAHRRFITCGMMGVRRLQREHQPESVFARAGITIDGWEGDAHALARELRDGRLRDAAAGRTLAGPHRADLLVTHLGKAQPAHLCSTGEQKALLLGLVLAHAELVADRVGRAPILLLDEVAAHLDPGRRAALFERLAGKGQVWMTGTEPELFDAVPGGATRYVVANGTVETSN
jgi:DNA replication and repair protein RecF